MHVYDQCALQKQADLNKKKRVLTKDFKVAEFFRVLCDEEGQKPVPAVGFSVAGLDRAIFGFYRFESFFNCLLFHSDIDFT